jgi:hypothetical protein
MSSRPEAISRLALPRVNAIDIENEMPDKRNEISRMF